MVIVGGQPGAGKTRSLDQAARTHPGVVPVVGDDLRLFHPDYRDLMVTDPLAMPEVTAQAANAWVHMSLDFLRGQGRSVLLETTLRQPQAVSATLAEFCAAGYRTELRVLAVPEVLSRMGTLTRYVAQVAEDGAGRWAPSRFHDAAYSRAPETVAEVASAGLVNRAIVVDRNANVLADITIASDRAGAAAELQSATWAGRRIESVTKAQARTWLAEMVNDSDVLVARGEDDRDLLATVCRLNEQVEAIAAEGWPDDPVRAAAEAARAHAAVAALPAGCEKQAHRPLRDRITERFEKARAQEKSPAAEPGWRQGPTRRGDRPGAQR